MLKWILIILALAGIYVIFFRKKDSEKSDEKIMVECEKCKTFIAKNEAINKNGRYFCSNDCLKS